MKQHCKHCQLRAKVLKRTVSSFGAVYKLECGHDILLTLKDHEEKERKRKSLIAQFLRWVYKDPDGDDELDTGGIKVK